MEQVGHLRHRRRSRGARVGVGDSVADGGGVMEALTLEQLDELEHSLKSGAGWSVWFTQESMCALIAMARASLADREDAQRWRKLRAHHWTDGADSLVVTRARAVRLGGLTYSGQFLDEAINAAQPPKD